MTVEAGPFLSIHRDSGEVASAAADLVARAAHNAIGQRGRFTLVLCGGSTPERTYRLLAEPDRAAQVGWSNTYLFFGDERFVPPDDPRSNFRMARTALIEHVPVPRSHIFCIHTHGGTAAECAATYAAQLAEFFSASSRQAPPQFDLILLGLGADGHTASLFPGSAALHVQDAWVTWSPPGKLPPRVDRITVTYPVLNAARQVAFLVDGEEKAAALQDILENKPSVRERPAAGVRPVNGTVAWLVDEAAASLLMRRH